MPFHTRRAPSYASSSGRTTVPSKLAAKARTTSSGRSGRVSIGLTSLAADGRAGRAVGECGPVRLYASATRSTLQWDFRPTSPPRAPGPSVGAWPGEVVQPRGVEEDD